MALQIATNSTIGHYILPKMIGRYWKGFLDSQLELNVGNSQDVIVVVADLRVDLEPIEGPYHTRELVT